MTVPAPRDRLGGHAFDVSTRDVEGVAVITLRGALDHEHSRRVVKTVGDLVRAGAESIVIDLGPLTFIDSAGMGALVRVDLVCRAAGTRLALTGARARIERAVGVAGLSQLLDNDPSGDRAVCVVEP